MGQRLDGRHFREQWDERVWGGQSRLAAFCHPQRDINNDRNENSSWRRGWRGTQRAKKAWQELGIYHLGKALCVFLSSCGA